MEIKKKRVNTLLPENILEKIDSFGDEMGLSRGNAISVIAKSYFDQQEVLKMAQIMSMEIEKENPQK